MNDADLRWMDKALEVAQRGWGRTSPNPSVGAVLVSPSGERVAEGWTQPPGQPHAEPHCLRAAGSAARGATMYVTLEPCCHHGRTPPCTEAILQAGVARVVVGAVDPFPQVAGQGIARLRAAGVEVEVGVREEACISSNLGFFRAILQGLPSVTLKAAITLDGRIASEAGESRWITGPEAREAGHRLRDTSDAILVGIGTVLADDPLLTTRLPTGGKDARPVVWDSLLRTPNHAAILTRGPLILCAEDAPAREFPAPSSGGRAPEVVRLPRGPHGVDTRAALQAIAARGYHRVLAEGGGGVHRALLDVDVVDRMEIFLNPRILAGGPGFVRGPGYPLALAPGFQVAQAVKVGGDLHISLARSALPLFEPHP